LTRGLAAEHLIDPEAVPARMLGETLALVYAGHVARAAGSRQRGI